MRKFGVKSPCVNLSNLKTFFDPNPIKIQSPDAIFYPATKPIINQALRKLPMNLYIWPSPFSPKNWKVGITPPDKAGHQTWRSIILWNMTMMSDYWINVYFVLQYLLCLSFIKFLHVFRKYFESILKREGAWPSWKPFGQHGHTVGQIRQKCKETSNLIWLS